MPASEDDLGLDLRLPWGRLTPPAPPKAHDPPEAPPPPPAAPPAPPVGSPAGPSQSGPSGPPEAASGASAAPASAAPDTAELQRSLRTLMLVLERRFDGIEERLAHVDIALPERLELIEALLEAQAAALAGAPRPDATAIVEQVDLHVALAGQDLEARIERALAGQDLEGRINRALAGQDMGARIDRLENLVVASHETTIEIVGELVAAGREAPAVAPDGPDDQPVAPALEARLDRLESLVDASHNLMMDALGQAAPGPALSRLEQRLEGAEAELRSRLDKLEHRVGDTHQVTIEAIKALPAADLVGSLIEGVVTTGEMLDAELMDLKRMLVDQQPANRPGDGSRSR